MDEQLMNLLKKSRHRGNSRSTGSLMLQRNHDRPRRSRHAGPCTFGQGKMIIESSIFDEDRKIGSRQDDVFYYDITIFSIFIEALYL